MDHEGSATYGEMRTYSAELEQRLFMTKVFTWMCMGLLVTAATAAWIAAKPTWVLAIARSSILFYGLLIGELVLVLFLSSAIEHMSAGAATKFFLLYAALNGVSFSVIFALYTTDSIAATFVVTAGTFGIMALYGYTTKTDLSSWGNLLIMSLIGLVLASLVNLYLQSSLLHWVISTLGVFTFVGLTARDTQRIKKLNVIGNAGTEEDQKEAIQGALILYLDFINLFLYLLRLLGRKK